MRRFALAVVLLAFALAPAAAASAAGTETARCADQSEASFPHAFSRPDSVVVGPLAFWLLRGITDATVENLREIGGWKSPALVRPGHTVTVSVDRPSRRSVRLSYTHHAGRDESNFPDIPHTVRFKACSRRRAMSDVDGDPVTFWSGFFVVRDAPTCLRLTIRVHRRGARHRKLPVAGGDCG